jgi:ATP-dependent Lon protease
MPKDYNLRPRKNKKIRVSNSDSSSSDDDYETEIDEDMMDEVEFKKFLHKLFPSRNLASKIKEMDAITEKMDKKDKKRKKLISDSDDTDENEEDVSDLSESSEEEDYNEDIYYDDGKINIVLTINGNDFEYEDENESEEEDENESESEEEDIEEDKRIKNKKDTNPIVNLKKEKDILKKIETSLATLDKKTMADSAVYNDLQTFAKEQREKVEKYEKKTTKKDKQKNLSTFKSLINDRKSNNELVYFQKLNIEEQSKILEKMEEVNKLTKIDKPYRFKMLEKDIPEDIKAVALKKLTTFQKMEPGSSEYSKMKNWVDAFMMIPFCKYINFDLSLEKNGPEECKKFMENSTQLLDAAVYGLNDAKMQIIQMIGTWISNPNAIGSAIAIKGPPGTGKTTLVKEGISKVLQRPFSLIALGGSTDSSFLEGHGYTYEGSTWGKIVSIIMESGCMNPVIYFDELDKVSETPKGEEIIGILTHLIDSSQNSEFHDKYFSDIKFDLSKCLFIFSYNDESKINPILRDRMYKIETKGYDAKEKATIARIHLLPSIRKQICFNEEDIVISDEVLSHIVQTYTGQEKGVRNLKRCIEIIFTKLNLYRFTDTSSEFFNKKLLEKVEFPYTLTKDDVDKLMIKKDENPYLGTIYS